MFSCGRCPSPCTWDSSQPPSLVWRKAKEGTQQPQDLAEDHPEAILPSVVLSAQLSRQKPCQAAGSSLPAPCQAWEIPPQAWGGEFGCCANPPAKACPVLRAVRAAGGSEGSSSARVWVLDGCRVLACQAGCQPECSSLGLSKLLWDTRKAFQGEVGSGDSGISAEAAATHHPKTSLPVRPRT